MARRQKGEHAEKAALAAELLRLNPFGGYCAGPCEHAGHTAEHYRETLRRYGGGPDLAAEVADALSGRPADEDRAGGRNTLTRFADLDEAS